MNGNLEGEDLEIGEETVKEGTKKLRKNPKEEKEHEQEEGNWTRRRETKVEATWKGEEIWKNSKEEKDC